jgi:hypothetical protein
MDESVASEPRPSVVRDVAESASSMSERPKEVSAVSAAAPEPVK